MQHGGAAEGEAEYGSQRGDQKKVRAEVKDVGKYGRDGENESQHIEPKRGTDGQIFAQTQLQQEGGQSDRGHNHQSQRTEECGTAGVDHHQSEREEQQTGGNDAPAAGLGRGGRVGSGIGQGFPSQVIQGRVRVFKWCEAAALASGTANLKPWKVLR